MSEGALGLASGPPGPPSGRNQSLRQPGASPPESLLAASLTGPWAGPGVGRAGPPRSAQGRRRLARRSRPPHFPRFPQPDGPRIRTVADPVIEGRSLVLEAIRSLAIACRAWAAYPSDHPNVTQAVGAAQTRVGGMLSAHGSVAIGVSRNHLRVGVWTLETAQARALAKALYQRQVAVLRMDRGIQPDELRALVQWLAGPAVPLEPGSPAAGPPGLPGARHLHLQPLDYSAVRLTDHTTEAPAETPPQAGVSLSDRLLNVLLEWGAPGDAAWSDDEPGTGSAVPAELAMVGWLRDFLKAQAARERGETARPDGERRGHGTRHGGIGRGCGGGQRGRHSQRLRVGRGW